MILAQVLDQGRKRSIAFARTSCCEDDSQAVGSRSRVQKIVYQARDNTQSKTAARISERVALPTTTSNAAARGSRTHLFAPVTRTVVKLLEDI